MESSFSIWRCSLAVLREPAAREDERRKTSSNEWDAGVSTMPEFVLAPTHEENVRATRETVEKLEATIEKLEVMMAETERKVDRLILTLQSLSRMTAKSPDGRTLINLVGQIFTKVQKLD
jgi:hypothetical protein